MCESNQGSAKEVDQYRATKYGDLWRSAIQYPGEKRDTLTVANSINVKIRASATENPTTGEFDNWKLTGGSPDANADKPAYFDAWTTDWLGFNSDWLNDGDYAKHKVSKNSTYRVKVGGAHRPLVVF